MSDKPETAAVVDLAQFDEAVKRQNDGVKVDIKSMDGKTPLGFWIRVAGPDSERAIKAQEEMADELIEEGSASPTSAAERDRRGRRHLAKITMEWGPKIILDGAELTCSVENAEKLYSRFRFIRDQIDVPAGNRARFLGKSTRP